MRVDAKKNLKKVASAYLQDPMATEREIAKRSGVSAGTAHRMLSKLEQGGVIERNDAIIAIESSDVEIVLRSQCLILEKMKDEDQSKKMSIVDLSTTSQVSQKRYSVLSGDVTNEDGGLKIEVINNYNVANDSL